jgi:hypothetical protein
MFQEANSESGLVGCVQDAAVLLSVERVLERTILVEVYDVL